MRIDNSRKNNSSIGKRSAGSRSKKYGFLRDDCKGRNGKSSCNSNRHGDRNRKNSTSSADNRRSRNPIAKEYKKIGKVLGNNNSFPGICNLHNRIVNKYP